MKTVRARDRLYATLLFAALVAGCHGSHSGDEQALEATPSPTPVPTQLPSAAVSPSPTPAASPSAISASPSPGPAVGTIEDLQPRVTVRRNLELIWKEADRDLPLFPYDAVRTGPSARAQILLNNGSRLGVDADSLIILKPALVKDSRQLDRAVFRQGHVTGKTQNELWVMTSAALLKIKPTANGKTASAKITVREGKQLRVELVEGEGSAVRTSPGHGASDLVPLIPKQPITLYAPPAADTFGKEQGEANWEKGPEVQAPPRPRKNPLPSKIGITILSPPNYANTGEDSIVIRGKVNVKPRNLVINDRPVELDANLAFNARVKLVAGANTLLIQATNENGELTFLRWMVIKK